MVAAQDHGPAPVWILCVQQERSGTFSCVCGLRAEAKHRVTCLLECRLTEDISADQPPQ